MGLAVDSIQRIFEQVEVVCFEIERGIVPAWRCLNFSSDGGTAEWGGGGASRCKQLPRVNETLNPPRSWAEYSCDECPITRSQDALHWA